MFVYLIYMMAYLRINETTFVLVLEDLGASHSHDLDSGLLVPSPAMNSVLTAQTHVIKGMH